MTEMTRIAAVAPPTHRPSEFVAYEAECKTALAPLLAGLLDMAEQAGWNRRTAASTLMYLAAQNLTTTKATA